MTAQDNTVTPSCCSVRKPPDATSEYAPSCCSCRSTQAKPPETAWEKFREFFSSVPVQLTLTSISGLALLASLFGHIVEMLPFHPAWIAIVVSGTPLLWGAVRELSRRHITAEVLVSTAILATIYTQNYFAGGEVAFIMMLGHLLENWTIRRARAGIEKLIQLTPQTARKISEDQLSSGESIIPASEVFVGDTLRVLPGEAIPVDGRILSGNTSIDQQLLTGEPLPVDKAVGEDVFAGTINRFGTFTMQATQVGEDSSLARMIRLVREAEMKKAPMERITDRWAAFLVPTAILTAILVGLATQNLMRAVTILVVFCPCSLVLATPTAIVAAIGCAARYGILIRSGEVLELLGKITTIAFDKTGTLTLGKPVLGTVRSLTNQRTDDELLTLAASVEQHSEHPLSRCIVEAAEGKHLTLSERVEAEILPGRGIQGLLKPCPKCDPGAPVTNILIGNEKLLAENGIELSESAKSAAGENFQRGETVVWVAADAAVCGFLSLTDSVRKTASETVGLLKKEKIDLILLTGDQENASKNIAEQVGLTSVYAGLLPEDKQRLVADQQSDGKILAMIGDGINDAPALKTANIGIAMGKIGSDLAIEAADITLVGDDISRIPFLVRLSKKTIRTILGNITLSMSINFVAVILAATGVINPVIGALVHNAGSLLVVFNASLLLGVKWEKL